MRRVRLGWIETTAEWRALGFYDTQAGAGGNVKILASSKSNAESRAGLTIEVTR